MRPKYTQFAGILIAALIVAASFFLLGGQLCIIKIVWGIPCPSCGLTRAYLRLFAGDISGAFFFHPLFFLPPLMVIAAFFIPPRTRAGRNIIIGASALFIVVWIVRMILFFPDTPPMDLNRDSLLFRSIDLISNLFH